MAVFQIFFFNAAAAFYTYVLAHLAIKGGVDVACFSQFVGSPPISKWGIKDMQFPSGTMISWETGLGNAKYWALKLILEHLQIGDVIQSPNIVQLGKSVAPVRQVACEAVGPWTFNNEITFSCNSPDARIEHIWADMGLTPSGECGNFKPNKNCSNALGATAWAALECMGRHTCTLRKESKVADFLTCPIESLVMKSTQLFDQRLTVQARCSGNEGIRTSAEYSGNSVYSLGFTSRQSGTKKLLLVNKESKPLDIKLDIAELTDAGAVAHIVDPQSVSRGAANGIRQEIWKPSGTASYTLVTLQPYAVAIAIVGNATALDTAAPSLLV